MTAIYTRVSTNQQDTASQERELQKWALGKTVRWFTDKATGKNMDRPGWRRLEEAIARGEVDTIVIWRLDRLGRTASGLTRLFDDLIARGVNLVSLRDSLDLSTPAGRLMANVLASVAQYETEVRSERQRAGIAAARAAGKRWGGRRRGARVKLTPEKERTIKRLHAAGESISAIARAVELSRPTVYAALR